MLLKSILISCMRRCLLILLLLMFTPIVTFAQVRKVAILETVDKQGDIPYAHKLMLRSNLSKAITNTDGFEAYDRTDIDAIMGEQDFQRTGLVSDHQIKQLGEMTGAAYILVAEAVKVDDQNMFITAKILNVETAKTEMTDNVLMAATPSDIQHGCESLANKLLGIRTNAVPTQHFHNNSVNKSPAAEKSTNQKSLQITHNTNSGTSQKAVLGEIIVFEDNSRGVVFYVSDKVCLAMSLDEARLKWDPIYKGKRNFVNIPDEQNCNKYFVANYAEICTSEMVQLFGTQAESAASWCVRHGRKWHLPSAAELILLSKQANNSSIINTLSQSGGVPFKGRYWVCNEHNKETAFVVDSEGHFSVTSKTSVMQVRAVRAF